MKSWHGVIFLTLLLCNGFVVLGQSLSTESNPLYLLHANEIEVFSDDTGIPIEMVVITTINATNNETSQINYSILNGTNSNVFQINKNGKISLKEIPVLGFYYLSVLVQDEKQRNTSCSVLIFFKSVNVKFTVTAGSKIDSWKEFQDNETVPIYIMVGWEPMLAFDIEIYFEPSVNFNFFSSDYSFINSGSGRFVGVIGYSENKRGFIKVAEIILAIPTKVKQLNFKYSYYNIIDRSLTQMKSVPGCQENILYDIHKDCQFDIRDVASLNYYQNLYKTVAVNSTNSVMDTNLNGVIDAEDVINLYDIYIGNSDALLKTQVIQPSQSSGCSLLILCETQYLGISSWIRTNSKMFAAFTYPSSVVHDQLQNSKLKFSVSFTKFRSDSNIKYIDLIEMKKTGNIYSLNISDWPVRAENVGVSIYFYPSGSVYSQGYYKKIFYAPRRVISTFKKKFDQPSEILNINMDSTVEKSILKLESSFNPQFILTSGITSLSCRSSLIFPIQMMFPYEYDMYVRDNKIFFENQFAIFYESYELINNQRVVEVKSVSATKGSIYIKMEVLVDNVNQKALVDDLNSALEQRTVVFYYNETNLRASKVVSISKSINSKMTLANKLLFVFSITCISYLFNSSHSI